MNPSPARRPLGAAAAALALVSACAVPARAHDPPPDLSFSTVSCRPENAAGPGVPGTTRPGDVVVCLLTARVTGLTNAYAITGDIAIPAGTVSDQEPNAQGVPTPAGAPTMIAFDTSVLGLTNPGLPKTATARFRITADAEPGTPIQPVAHIRDPVGGVVTMTSNLLAVMPQPADLTPSTTTCADVDPAAPLIRAGDAVECALTLAAQAGREDAVGVTVTAGIPRGTAWAAGGNESFHFGGAFTWLSGAVAPSGTAAPGSVPSGGTAGPLRFRFTIDPSVVGGTTIFVNGQVSWTNALSGSLGSLGVGAPPLVIAPGPALLTSSSLGCVDLGGAPLLPGDTLFCTATVAAAAGHEDAADVGGFADVPALTVAGAPAAAGGARIPFDPGQLGAIRAGGAKSVSYTLRVAAAAVPGNVIVATAAVAGRSAPSGVALTQRLVSAPLVVGARATPAAVAAAAVSPAAAAAAGVAAAEAAAKDTRICASRRVVVVNVKPPRRTRWRSVTFSFAKKTVRGAGAGARTGTFRARLVFQGLPKGALRVAILGVTTTGRKVRSARTYNLCAKKR